MAKKTMAKKTRQKPRLHTLDDNPDIRESIPSGIVDLDLKLGGGWPVGVMSIIYGPESSGKTLISLITTATAQRTCRFCYTLFSSDQKCVCGKSKRCEVLYVDSENYLASAKAWAKAIGVAGDTLVSTPDDAEEAFDTVVSRIKDGKVDLVIIDSVAMLSPEAERESSFYEWTTGLHPRLVTRFARVWGRELDHLRWKEGGRPPTLVVVNQVREKVGVIYGNPETQPGGRGLRHASGVIVRTSRKAIEMSPDKDPQPLSQTVRFTVEKTKVAAGTKREGEFNVAINNYIGEDGVLRPIGHVENEKTLLRYAKQFEVIEGKGGKYVFGGKSFKAEGEIAALLKRDIRFRSELFQAVNSAYAKFTPHAVAIKDDGGKGGGAEEQKAQA